LIFKSNKSNIHKMSNLESPRRPLPSLPVFTSTQKLEPLQVETSNLGDLSEIKEAESSRREKRRRDRNKESNHQQSEDNDQKSINPEASARHRRRKRKTARNPDVSARAVESPDVIKNSFALLPMAGDDVIMTSKKPHEVRTTQRLPEALSRKEDKIFVQTTTGFKGRTTDWYKSKQLQQTNRGSSRWQDLPSSSKEKTSQIALNLLTVTDKFTFFIHSLLAGLAIWQYEILALPVQLLFQISLVFCFISSLDRFDLNHFGLKIFTRLCKVDAKAWMILAYFGALITNYCMVGFDVWIGTNSPFSLNPAPATNSTLTSDYLNEDPQGNYQTWQILNTLRMSFVVCGWLLLSSDPVGNNTIKNIYSTESNINLITN